MVDGHADLLGYVAAGVLPGRSAVFDDVQAALDFPIDPNPQVRQAFLDDHIRPGAASQRILDGIMRRLDDPTSSGGGSRGRSSDRA